MESHAYCELDLPLGSGNERLSAAFSEPLCILIASRAEDVPGLLDEAELWSRAGQWVIGFVAYEAARAFEKALHAHPEPPDGLPFAAFAVFRDRTDTPRARGEYLCGAWRDETSGDLFDAGVARIQAGIRRGDYYQVNYTTRVRAPFLGDGLSFFDALRARQPSAYCAYIEIGQWRICSVSPELFFKWDDPRQSGAARALTCRPMKGTASRCDQADDDRAAAESLHASPKERAENLMIVDLLRNDLSRVAQPGSVSVMDLFSVEAWPTVWQMTSTISCRTADDTRLRDVFRALFPCGSVTGAPKAASTAAIRGLEASPRGVYCGAIGTLLPGGRSVFSVGIRTPVIDSATKMAEYGVGSGITLDSTPPQEHAEWGAKQVFLKLACPEYELLETLRLHHGRYWLLRGHLDRLRRSAEALGFRFGEQAIRDALRLEAQRRPQGQWLVRLRLATGGDIHIEALPLDALPAEPRFALSTSPVSSANPWLRHKTTRRTPYDAHASRHAPAYDTLLYNERGELTEFTRGNLVVEKEGRLLTPHADCGLLPGVFRATLLARRRIQEGILCREDLTNAACIWFINSVRGVIEMRRKDGTGG